MNFRKAKILTSRTAGASDADKVQTDKKIRFTFSVNRYI